MPFVTIDGADALLVLGVEMVSYRVLHLPLTHRKAVPCPLHIQGEGER